MRASVVIPCSRFTRTLEVVLDGFAAQTCGPQAFSVVIVEDGSGDEGFPPFSKRLREGRYPFSLEIVPGDRTAGRSAAFNRGIFRTQAELVVLGCEDIVPGKTLVAECLRTMESFGGCDVAIFGSIVWHPKLPEDPLMNYIRPGVLSPRACEEPPRYRYFKAGVVCLRRAVLERARGFDPEFGSSGWEDVELGYRLFRSGVGLAFHPGVVGYRRKRLRWPWLCAEVERNAEASLIFHRKHPECREDAPRFHLAQADRGTQAGWARLGRNLGRIIARLERLLKNARNRESHLAWKMLHECYSMGLEIAYGKGVGSGLEAAVRRNEAEPAGRTADRARLTERLVEFEIRLAKAWEFVGEEAEARRLYDRVVREGETVEKVSVAMKELAQIYEKQGDCTKLVHLYRALAALTNDPFSHQFYAYRTARTYERMGLFSRAISSYRKMSGMRSLGKEFQSAALFRLGLLYKMGFGTEAEAAEHFRKCLDLEPNHPKARAALGITGETLAGSSLSCLREGVR